MIHAPTICLEGTNDPPLHRSSFTEDGECPGGDRSKSEKESVDKKIAELEKLEMDLATRYGMVDCGEIDSVEVFDEAKFRAFSDPQSMLDAKQMDELDKLRYRRTMILSGV
ncbi:hypothetical protein EDD18DRAFT_1335791 [Armillaria luteobubalina]|uniref:Uncharacterized protein n=1 Tax=Armillaria luteobubalina TaxID=153913 RepID=A0AA39PJU9_9AGAR|nr:hypothetical protein EDD18DRAFT_1335791 [Armillaria luteobubalina]